MSWDMTYKLGTAGVGMFVGYLFGGWGILLQILFTFMVVDQCSGLLASFIEGKLNSKVGSKGIARKVLMLLVVAVCHLLDRIFHTGNITMDGAIFFYLGNELLSFIENVGRAGVPLPPKVKNAVAILQGKGNQASA